MAAKKNTKQSKKALEMTPLMILSVVAFFLIAFILLTQDGNMSKASKAEKPRQVVVVSDEEVNDNDTMENEVMEK